MDHRDCIGALDGTLVRASVPLSIQGRFYSRKGETTQNVLAAITFDLKFSYVLAGWEGSAHDSRILSDALSRPRRIRIPEGKYYLADARYVIRNGHITLYHGVRYHLKEFSAQGPENAKELFNLRHSSLRITIERVFGILEETISYIVLACCIIHNHIMGVDPSDLLNQGLYKEPEFDLIISTLTEQEEREKAREWSAKRDEIAQTMWTDYMARNNRMGKGNKEGTSKQFRWTKPIEHLFLEILAEEAQKGNKPSNTFKVVSINRVVEAISKKFQVQYDPKHVENHLRTVKKDWQIICIIRVVGKDIATGSFSRTYADIDLDDDNQDSVPIDCENEATEELFGLLSLIMVMTTLKYDIPLLDRNTRFKLWHIKIQAVLVQIDLEDALLGIDKILSTLMEREKKRGYVNEILTINLRVDRNLQTKVRPITSTRRNSTLSLSAIYNKIKREATNQKEKQPEQSGEADIVEDYNDGELLVASADNSNVSEEWILDYGFTFHMSPNKIGLQHIK
ncbi:hypothetical protein GOBAR_AA07069 [Gossypium barbadense]|uniref:DDE Tnp4 domain-containing protein n=1 Tax=Gossypium barbadense TaxID=3634 RepID=A0A2P5YD71_GOSBA|nr:hypothetical protein GOBAR_AA07069 [Gossypium barbadense]